MGRSALRDHSVQHHPECPWDRSVRTYPLDRSDRSSQWHRSGPERRCLPRVRWLAARTDGSARPCWSSSTTWAGGSSCTGGTGRARRAGLIPGDRRLEAVAGLTFVGIDDSNIRGLKVRNRSQTKQPVGSDAGVDHLALIRYVGKCIRAQCQQQQSSYKENAETAFSSNARRSLFQARATITSCLRHVFPPRVSNQCFAQSSQAGRSDPDGGPHVNIAHSFVRAVLVHGPNREHRPPSD